MRRIIKTFFYSPAETVKFFNSKILHFQLPTIIFDFLQRDVITANFGSIFFKTMVDRFI